MEISSLQRETIGTYFIFNYDQEILNKFESQIPKPSLDILIIWKSLVYSGKRLALTLYLLMIK